MLSLDNSYNIDELRAFAERCQRLADGRTIEYVAELKIDGLSISLQYEDTVLARGVAHVQAGAGIVADSVPQQEYRECVSKAGALIDAIERAEARA